MNKSTMEFLKFFNESIKNIHVLTEEMYAQMMAVIQAQKEREC